MDRTTDIERKQIQQDPKPVPRPARRVVPYVPGLKIKYLVPDPFGTGR